MLLLQFIENMVAHSHYGLNGLLDFLAVRQFDNFKGPVWWGLHVLRTVVMIGVFSVFNIDQCPASAAHV